MTQHGIYTTVDDRPAVRFDRRLPHPVAAVWRGVTDPGELAHWFPCAVELDGLRPGAAMRFDFGGGFVLDGEVLELDVPRRFAFRWGKDVVRLELDPDGDDATLLSFVHVLHEEGEDAAAKTMAGWHVCLDAMEAALAGAPIAPSGGPSPERRRRYDEYVAAGVPAGAAIPGT
ncbi:SRPBCC family protein [Capillimicrobium parvum]|uniref:Activator of Hsp90 ATPase homologue 1/2-like C-terminal domain-containing protein n=1 Tax=Capillimicrobium parvum TaxID=2884022 RepID=A0A9E6XXY7_9ACTN|nr:SRPBCC family protein [Capillimicrobium parvum]UGS36499.1 hypothetical protein DSM104329_02905 [Capillimicrobium parvum]